MTGASGSDPLYEEIVHCLNAALAAARLYSTTHPTVAEHLRALLDAVRELQRVRPVVLIGFVGGEVIADDTLLFRLSTVRGDLAREMQALGIHRLLLQRGVTRDELAAFIHAVVSHKPRPGAPPPPDDTHADFLTLPHLSAGPIPVDANAGKWGPGAIPVRRVYGESVESARSVWQSAAGQGQPELPLAREAIERLAEAVGTSGSLMIGLTGMKEHDDYTFTHMVNTSILAMAQARALGIDGERLRALGLAAFLHDIGKVRTPLEILNKPGALTPRELEIMRRHPIDGATILRGTREMPRLAGVVALEHHLRLDGSGYPTLVARPTLNLATVLCGVADVYDAMRSERRYQQAFPTDRIIEVMRRNDGRQLDQHLVRRFIHLMGIYPPGTVVRLASSEVAVVVESDGPDPAKPTVRVLFDGRGGRLRVPETRQLWRQSEGAEDGDAEALGFRITAALDPAEYRLDPVAVLQPA